jgi:hypothetical protein
MKCENCGSLALSVYHKKSNSLHCTCQESSCANKWKLYLDKQPKSVLKRIADLMIRSNKKND